MSRHAELADAAAFWRQFVTAFYFDNPKDELAGALLEYKAEGPLNDPTPHLVIQTKDGRRRTVTATQERLKAALADAAPAIGDRIRIVFTGEAERAAPGYSKAKLFTIEVIRKGSQSEGGAAPVRGSAGAENASRTGGELAK